MGDCILLKSDHIAEIIFDGNRSYASKNIITPAPLKKGRLSVLFADLLDYVRPEEETNSLASAKEYFRAIGYQDWQVGQFEKILKNCLSSYIDSVRDAAQNGEYYREVPTLEKSERYYLGAHVGEAGLDLDRKFKCGISGEDALTLRGHFIRQLETARHEVPGLMFTHFNQFKKSIVIERPPLPGTPN